MSTRLDPAKHPWMRAPETRAVMDALTDKGGEARFVGGAVRNALLGEKVTDVDIATPLTPEDVTKRLVAAGLQAVPTGIEHGTVTAVAGGKPFEVTTLRRDVSTDGRRAVVAFTKDWTEDAARRDFTMNALYASAGGDVFDLTGGIEDLKAGRVRFVGDPVTRIREDYLRILRLFRFHAWYGRGAIDKAALAAATAEKAGLKKLSGERVQKELLKLLAARDPMPVLGEMEKAGLLSEILPGPLSLTRLQGLVKLDADEKARADALLRLAALLGEGTGSTLAEKLKLSNIERERLIALKGPAGLSPDLTPQKARACLYRRGLAWFSDSVRLLWATDAKHAAQWRALLQLAEKWQRPKFPLDGRDAMAAGIKEGPAVGKILGELEQWWIENDFKPDRAALLARLRGSA